MTVRGESVIPGWEFQSWAGDLNSDENPLTLTMTKDYEIIGVFERVDVGLEVLVEGQGSVTEAVVTAPSSEYPYETVVELTAEAASGWVFASWTGDVSGTENPVLVTMDGPKSVTAVFEQDGPWPRDYETEVKDVTNTLTAMTWMDRNLGSNQVATRYDDEQSFGDLYQWGRPADGHQKRTSGTRSSLSSSIQPGHGDFISTNSFPWNWHTTGNTNLWQGGAGQNNPCPVGYRIPTIAEWVFERQSWGSNNRDRAFDSPLKLPSSGIRNINDGSVADSGGSGYYWSSTVGGFSVGVMLFSVDQAYEFISDMAFGFSVRCIKN